MAGAPGYENNWRRNRRFARDCVTPPLHHARVWAEDFGLCCNSVGIFYALQEAKVLIEQWRHHYSRVRPHSSLGYRPPAPEAIQFVPPMAGSAPLGSLAKLRPPSAREPRERVCSGLVG
ncbi:MAG TPA: integrase core domain-containing protein [Phycisphaerae bacterium]|nr:integrase core domain-containing protein [Phycisphaerae bacterium]